MSDKAGIVPRLGAYRAIENWQKGLGFVAESLPKELAGQDRAIAMTLALGVCRNKSLLEYNLSLHVKFMPQPELQWLLWIGLFQIYEQEHFPIHVSLDLSVELARKLKFKKELPLVNGLLRKVQREGFKVPRGTKKIKDVATCYSHPSWLVHKWHEELGFDKMIRRCRNNNVEAPVWFRMNPTKTNQAEIDQELNPTEWRFDRYFTVEGSMGPILKHDFFKEGKISVQNPASSLMVSLLDVKGSEKVLDLCGAPGGKSALILEDYSDVGLVLGDLKVDRLKRSSDIKDRLGLDFFAVASDADHLAYKEQSFDKVLVDAPCSNLGVISKRPEARWNASAAELEKHKATQIRILNQAAKVVKKGGVMVYGTCSPEPEETNQVIEAFLEANPNFQAESARSYVHRRYTQGMFLKIIPQPGSLDGFFGARLKRVS